ncbi:hypothetical protein [Aegicerativicinus sediminis]
MKIWLSICCFLVFSTFSSATPDTLWVPQPKRDIPLDSTNIQITINRAKPHDTIYFPKGVYRVGDGIKLETADLTLIGANKETIFKASTWQEFAESNDDLDLKNEEIPSIVRKTGFHILAPRQTIRGFTFDQCWHGIVIGNMFEVEVSSKLNDNSDDSIIQAIGGHLITDNKFTRSSNGMRALVGGEELTLITNNLFIDVYHAIGIHGENIHFTNNKILSESPESVPIMYFPGEAINVNLGTLKGCKNTVIEKNLIEGSVIGIRVSHFPQDTKICEGVSIIGNEISVKSHRLISKSLLSRIADKDSVIVGLPIIIEKYIMPNDSTSNRKSSITDIIVKDNLIQNAFGLGLKIDGAEKVIVQGNIFKDIKVRQPFPGVSTGQSANWPRANGSAIWISDDSFNNLIENNSYQNIEGVAITIEGDSNNVKEKNGSMIKDLGSGNTIIFEKN